jgi:antitoxin VapB
VSRSARREALLALAAQEPEGDGDRVAVVLSSFADVAWYTGGFDVRIDRSGSTGSTVIVVSADGEWVVTDAIEAPRLRDEEPVLSGIELVEHPWTDGPDGVIADLAGGDRRVLRDLDVSSLRTVLDDDAIARYRTVGADARAAIDEAAAAVDPSMSELDAAAVLASAAWRRDLHAPVLLVGGASRVARFRHPVPTAAPLGERAMLVGSFERGGLFASVTRFVHFEAPSPDLAHRFEVTDELLRRMREDASVPGRTLGEAFADLQGWYAEAGFADEWPRHHQGGIAGYRSREVIARPGDPTVIRAGMAFAWNPSVVGAKSEETFVLPPEGGAAEVLT